MEFYCQDRSVVFFLFCVHGASDHRPGLKSTQRLPLEQNQNLAVIYPGKKNIYGSINHLSRFAGSHVFLSLVSGPKISRVMEHGHERTVLAVVRKR